MTDKPKALPDPVPTPEELAAQRAEKVASIRAMLRTSIPTRIEVLKRQPFDAVIARHERANRTMQQIMAAGMVGKSKRQTGEAFLAFIDAIATCAFASEGVTILDDHYQDVHPEVAAAKKQGRVLSFEALTGFLGALTGSKFRQPAPPVIVTGTPPELREDVAEDVIARRRAKFGTEG